MSSTTLFILFVSVIAILFLVLNLLFAPHNPYAEKFSSFECGFHSFLGQNRSQFNVKFFIFGLLFLIFDLEITLIFPYAVSQSNNEVYGLIIVFIFMVIVTFGFIYELGKGALKLESKQNFSNLSNNSKNLLISHVSLNNKKIGLPTSKEAFSTSTKRYYSTSPKGDPDSLEGFARKGEVSPIKNSNDFWRKVNSSDENNPFFIVNSFLKNFPNRELAKSSIDFNLINSILNAHLPDFNLTLSEFNSLKEIKPISFNLPVDSSFKELMGKYTHGKETGKAGAYKITNKKNGLSYIGSSISLVNRLFTGYFGPNLKNRVIDLAIKEIGLDKFQLDVYLLPENMIKDCSVNKTKAKSFALALEQILLLEYNPEYNVLKVAGSPAGLKRTPESMLPSFIKSSKPTYLYDIKNKELVYISKTRSELCELIPAGSNIGKYTLDKNRFYLDRFFVSDFPLSEDIYNINLRSKDELVTYTKKISVD